MKLLCPGATNLRVVREDVERQAVERDADLRQIGDRGVDREVNAASRVGRSQLLIRGQWGALDSRSNLRIGPPFHPLMP